jgi:signal transduction histidine kinase
MIRLVVCDDGKGLGEGAPRKGAMGLLGMQERARQFGGKVTVARGPGAGTVVEVEIPARSEGGDVGGVAA